MSLGWGEGDATRYSHYRCHLLCRPLDTVVGYSLLLGLSSQADGSLPPLTHSYIAGRNRERWREQRVTTDHVFLRAAKYETDDETDVLISRSTWSLKLSGLIAGVLLVIGRSASYGNITWSPA